MSEPSFDHAMLFEQCFRNLKLSIRNGMRKQVHDELGITFTDFPVLIFNQPRTNVSDSNQRTDVGFRVYGVSHDRPGA